MGNSNSDQENGGKKKAKTTNLKEYRWLNNQLRRETEVAKEIHMEERYDEIIDFQRKVSMI